MKESEGMAYKTVFEKSGSMKTREEIIEKIKNLKLDEQLNAEGVRLLILECING